MSPPPLQLRLPWLGRRAPERGLLAVRVTGLDLRFTAAVHTHVPGAMALLVSEPPPVPVRLLHGQAAVAEGPGPGEEMHGTLLGVTDPGGEMRDDLVQFVCDAAPDRTAAPEAQAEDEDGAAQQRRAWVRTPAIFRVTMVPDRLRLAWLEGSTRDVSAGGLLVVGAERLDRGALLRVRLELPVEELERLQLRRLTDQPIIDARARVVRRTSEDLRGLKIDSISEPDRDRLVRYVMAREREWRALQREERENGGES